MGYFRFRKVVSLGKFLKINISKTGVSASVGRPGATLNIKKDRVDGTLGLPGTGLSYKENLSKRECASIFLLLGLLAVGAGTSWKFFSYTLS
jgi:hypothetical protein